MCFRIYGHSNEGRQEQGGAEEVPSGQDRGMIWHATISMPPLGTEHLQIEFVIEASTRKAAEEILARRLLRELHDLGLKLTLTRSTL